VGELLLPTTVKLIVQIYKLALGLVDTTVPLQWFLVAARLYEYQPLQQIVQIPVVLLKEGAVIGAVLGTRKVHH
jgi:hypothetical protein